MVDGRPQHKEKSTHFLATNKRHGATIANIWQHWKWYWETNFKPQGHWIFVRALVWLNVL